MSGGETGMNGLKPPQATTRHSRSNSSSEKSQNVSTRATKKPSPKLEHYFYGPRDTARHSKLPLFFRIHGSVLPLMILPLIMVGLWALLVCEFLIRWRPDQAQKFKPTMLTVMGFLVGIGLSLRNTTAYERYNEGRRYWASMHLQITNLARLIWINGKERDGDLGKEDLLAKVTAINLLIAFAKSVSHRLRFEPYMDYDDMRGYVDYLATYSREANVGVNSAAPKHGVLKRFGEILGITFCEENPRRMVKSAEKPTGNLPLEILGYLSAYFDSAFENKILAVAVYQQQSIIGLNTLNDILTGTDRIVNTPLPIAYSITIAQIAWVYIIILPFQLVNLSRWAAIPSTLLAAYIILGLLYIGTELENPFGDGVNDLPLELFCDQIEHDCDVMVSKPAPKAESFMKQIDNMPLYPQYMNGYADWAGRSLEEIREALRLKMDSRAASWSNAPAPEQSSRV